METQANVQKLSTNVLFSTVQAGQVSMLQACRTATLTDLRPTTADERCKTLLCISTMKLVGQVYLLKAQQLSRH